MRNLLVFVIPEKPNAITPNNPFKEAPLLSVHDDVIQKAEFLDTLRSSLKSTQGVPKQKYKYPMTTNQELGWFDYEAQERPKTVGRFNHNLNSTAITRFAADYERQRGINPFKIKERIRSDVKLEDVLPKKTEAKKK